MTSKVFIDGAAGTTGLEIRERLADRADLALIQLSDAERKDVRARTRALNEADAVILCLPDDAAREAVSLIENPSVRVIDASTAHRVAPDWTYGFAELEANSRARIAASKRVSNPGCYPTGFLALVRPLVRAGIVPGDFPLTVNAVSGYSGGGKAMIEEFENRASPSYTETVVRSYALTLSHKHVPEMQVHAGLTHPPVFAPNVGRFYRGMILEVPLQLWALPKQPTVAAIHEVITAAYQDAALIDVARLTDGITLKTLDAESMSDTNRMKLYVFGNDMHGQARLAAVLDNLGKGASGAAVQNLNLMLGLPETAGLV
ncbi:MAG TPA: N-acetyl-gamma-glutamyl-phosphate reductase [Rhizomicrobium sp.]|nr:N-acetyl-gamma-glutamyl-phosphate reductase [Rhizomicrobium sp.]